MLTALPQYNPRYISEKSRVGSSDGRNVAILHTRLSDALNFDFKGIYVIFNCWLSLCI
jgi:hypothetical protein